MIKTRTQRIDERLRQIGYVPEKMNAIEQNRVLLEDGHPDAIPYEDGESWFDALARWAKSECGTDGEGKPARRFAMSYERHNGDFCVTSTGMVFWVGCRKGDLHGGPVRRHLTSCYRPAPVFDADGTLVFKGNALSDELYVVPECEYRFLQGEGSERWRSGSNNESEQHIESVPETSEPKVRPNTRDERKVPAESPSAPQNDSSDTNQARKRESVAPKTPKRARSTKKMARKPKVSRPRRRSCVMGRPGGDLERATLMIGYWNACASA